ncbi:hypothetical protein [Pseudomonas veronii]
MSNYEKLKELAEATKGWDNLKSCWPEETEDGDLEVNWFVGAVTEDDDKYPVLEVNTAQYDALEDAGRLARYYAAANPAAVLALIAENEALKGPHDWLAEDLIKELVDNAQAIQENADDGEDDQFVIVLLAAAQRIRRQEANIEKLRAENELLAKTADCWDRLNVQNKALSDSFRAERDQAEQDYKDVVGTIELRDIEISKLRAEVAGLRTGYEAYERVNAELKAENERLRDDLDQIQYDANAWRNGEESVWIEVFNIEGDDPFICAISGKITVEQLALIQAEILEYREDYFEKGSGLYVFRCAHCQAHYDNVGMTEPAHWETDFESYSPFPWEEEEAALGKGEQS